MTTAAPAPGNPDLALVLETLCDDAFFAVAGSGRLDVQMLAELAQRRAAALAGAKAGLAGSPMTSWEPWLLGLCAAIAPVAPPRWMPMADLVVGGLSLEHGARGLRSLFTSRPSDTDVERVRSLGTLAVRTLGAVLGSGSVFDEEARLLRAALAASLGLPDGEAQRLAEEAPLTAEALAIHGDMDGRFGRGLVRGGFFAAMSDGMDPPQEQAVVVVARKLGLTTDELNAARLEGRRIVDAGRAFGNASVEGLRYVLADDPAASERLGGAAARLTLPATHRREAMAALTVGGPVALGKKHGLDRRERGAVLALTWLAALRANPTVTARARLASRHDDLALDLGDFADGARVRGELDGHLASELRAAQR